MDIVPGQQTSLAEVAAFLLACGGHNPDHGPNARKRHKQLPQRRNWPRRRDRRAMPAPAAGAAFARAGFTDPTLVLRWSEIAGPEVARLAQPLKFAEGPRRHPDLARRARRRPVPGP